MVIGNQNYVTDGKSMSCLRSRRKQNVKATWMEWRGILTCWCGRPQSIAASINN
jgi:hypothetical protein